MGKYLSERQQAVADWLEANGITPANVPLDAELTIDDSPEGRVIRCEVFHRDSNGRQQIDDTGKKAATRFVTVPLRTEPPEWWQPWLKPSRDELLAVLDKVQQLAERWKHTSDRKNGPRQELLTALGEYAHPEAP